MSINVVNSEVLKRIKKEVEKHGVTIRPSAGHDRYDRVHNKHNRGG